MKTRARDMREENKKEVFYQIFLRSFTKEGTIEAARKRLPALADLGVSMLYICALAKADDDTDRKGWSPRQIESGLENPKNPYRIKDYFAIDEEYGSEEDLKLFVEDAHALGLKVMLDLVYLHCGPNSVFLKDHPEFIVRDENGAPLITHWRFPHINFELPEVREYLISNMLYLLRTYNVDGFRCDVGDKIPLDFWVEARKRIEEEKPDVVMLNEGYRAASLEEAFEWNYSTHVHRTIALVFERGANAKIIQDQLEADKERFPIGGRSIHYIDNHDKANDTYYKRYETTFGESGMECALALLFTIHGAPFIYNGNEICDASRHSIYSNRYHGNYCVDWSKASTPEAERRLKLIKELSRLYRSHPALYDGETEFLKTTEPERSLAYLRTHGNEKIAVFIHTTPINETILFDLPAYPTELKGSNATWKYGNEKLTVSFSGQGYLIVSI